MLLSDVLVLVVLVLFFVLCTDGHFSYQCMNVVPAHKLMKPAAGSNKTSIPVAAEISSTSSDEEDGTSEHRENTTDKHKHKQYGAQHVMRNMPCSTCHHRQMYVCFVLRR